MPPTLYHIVGPEYQYQVLNSNSLHNLIGKGGVKVHRTWFSTKSMSSNMRVSTWSIKHWFKIFAAGQGAIYRYIYAADLMQLTKSRYSKSGRWCRSIIPHTQSPSADKRTSSRHLKSLFTLHTDISSSFAVMWAILMNYIKEYICIKASCFICVCVTLSL